MRVQSIAWAVAVMAVSVVFLTAGVATAEVMMDATHFNGSFENPTVSSSLTGYGSDGTVEWNTNVAPADGWTVTPGKSQTQIMTAGVKADSTVVTAAEGNQFMLLGPGSWLQIAGMPLVGSAKFLPDTVYTLDYSIASSESGGEGYVRAYLAAAGNPSVKAENAASATPWEWSAGTTLTVDTALNPTWVGKSISVYFTNLSTLYDVAVDNVVVANNRPVPEPATFTLMASGILGLLAYAWRRWK